MGRHKQNELRTEQYTQMVRNLMETDAWKALPSSAQSLYPWLRMEWKGSDFNNNGKIQLSVRQAAEKMGVSNNTANSAFHALQAKGFIVLTEYAHLGVAGAGKSASYELTEISLIGQPTGRKLYKEWFKGRDYPVQKSTANNPNGRNSKTKPLHQNEDSNVVKFNTLAEKVSQK